MYIKKQIDKILEIYRAYIYNDKILKEVYTIISKKTLTKTDRLKFDKLIKTLDKDINEVY